MTKETDDISAAMQQGLDEAVDVMNNPQHVPMNMYETNESVVVVVPLPGVMPDDIDITITGSKLELNAAMRTPAPKNYLVHEWHYGPYERTVEIPEGYGADPSASFGNGHLAIRLGRGEAIDGAVKINQSS